MKPVSHSDDLLSIGPFSEAALLSPKALRLYEKRGLLVPHAVDPDNGYRFYRIEQARTGRLISLLRTAGMSLDAIQEVLALPDGDAIAVLDTFRDQVRTAAASTATLLDQARGHFRGSPMNTKSLTTDIRPEQAVLSLLVTTYVGELDERIREAHEQLSALAAERGLTVPSDAFGIFHAPITADSDGPIEVCLPVDRVIRDTPEGIRSHRLGGGAAVAVTVEGDDTAFPAILAAYDRGCEWIDEQKATRVGPPREIWHVLPWDDTRPARMAVLWHYA